MANDTNFQALLNHSTGMSQILVYGAYGYTGVLIAELAAEQGIPVLLSGRNAEKLALLGDRLGLPYAQASLDDPAGLDALLSDCSVVLHCAGPFVQTYQAMAEACLRTGCHYLDITGEIAVFEELAALHGKALERKVMLMPGVGFDVVPTDCTAAYLAERLPDAVQLSLAFKSVGSRMSHGTASTMVLGLGEPNYQRRSGQIVPVPMGSASLSVDFGRGPTEVSGIPWGDVSTAYYTTGIPNIATYVSLPASARRGLRMARLLGPVLRSGFVRRRAQRRVDKAPAGPSARDRAAGFSLVWGQVRNAEGEVRTVRTKTLNGYDLTAAAGLEIAQRVLAGRYEAGFQTPAGTYGSGLLREVDPAASFEDL